MSLTRSITFSRSDLLKSVTTVISSIHAYRETAFIQVEARWTAVRERLNPPCIALLQH